MTTRGFGVEESTQVGELIADVLDAPRMRRTWRRCAPGLRELTASVSGLRVGHRAAQGGLILHAARTPSR